MTRYFMKFTPLFAAEVQMMTPPRHQPRGSGRIRSSFRYSADDVRCKDCTRYDSGHLCHLNECIWLIAVHNIAPSLLIQKPGCHVPKSLLDRARLICKAFRRSSMTELPV